MIVTKRYWCLTVLNEHVPRVQAFVSPIPTGRQQWTVRTLQTQRTDRTSNVLSLQTSCINDPVSGYHDVNLYEKVANSYFNFH